jgi:hypothetical protein
MASSTVANRALARVHVSLATVKYVSSTLSMINNIANSVRLVKEKMMFYKPLKIRHLHI